MKIILPILLFFVNCLSYDIHPDYLMGTSIIDDSNQKKFPFQEKTQSNQSPIFLLGSIPNVKIQKKVIFRFSELYLLPIYTGGVFGYLGTRNNGELNNLLKSELSNIEVNQNSTLVVQNIKIKIKSFFLLDFENNYLLMGLLLRYYPVFGEAEIAVVQNDVLMNYFQGIK